MVDPSSLSEELYAGYGWVIARENALLPDGRVKTVARGHLCDTVHVLAFPSDNSVLLLREYRPFWKDFIWMIPSGKVDKETDLDAAAQRELREETGYRAGKIQRYCACKHTERVDFSCQIYLARELTRDPLPQDATEFIEVHELCLTEAIENVLGSSTIHTVSAFALLRYARESGK